MPKPYSQDLRDRVIDAVEGGELSRRAAARRYVVALDDGREILVGESDFLMLPRAGCLWLESMWGFPNRRGSDSTCWLGGGQQECRSHIRKTCATG